MAVVHTAWDHVSQNVFKTWLIMFLFSLFTVGVVYVLARGLGFDQMGGLSIVGFALILAGVMNFVSYYFSDKIVLGMSGAKPIEKKDNPGLYRMVENLSIAAGLPTPKVYIMDEAAPNAFATGRDPKHAVVAFTKGILEKLDKHELEGVTAHELSHVGNRDTLVMTVVSVLVGTIAIISDMFLRSMWFGGNSENRDRGAIFAVLAIAAAILAPIAATLIQLAISRRREFLADASGVLLTRYPQGLANALLKIASDRHPLKAAHTGTAHLFIMNPLKGKEAAGWFTNLFNTHPPVEARIKALQEMSGRV